MGAEENQPILSRFVCIDGWYESLIQQAIDVVMKEGELESGGIVVVKRNKLMA